MRALPTIVLLHSPQAEGDDPYETAFAAAGFRPRSVPVLRYVFAGEELHEVLENADRYAALVLTSPRAVEAIVRLGGACMSAWRGRTAYVVGVRTAAAARSIGLRPVGEETGSGTALAAAIVAARPSEPLLFLASDRRRDAIPDALAAAGIGFEERCAYETHLRDDFGPDDLAADWLAFFSPSGVEAVSRMPGRPRTARCAAIGATTAAALAAAGLQADAVAADPTPEALVAAVRAIM